MGSNTLKFCKSCLQFKSLDDFYIHKNTKDRRHTYCKICSNHKSKIAREKHLDETLLKQKQYHYRKRYGLTLEELETIKNEVDNRCEICKRPRRLVVDHDHKTEIFRGVLCDKCNQGLGSFEDDTELLANAKAYLERKKECKVLNMNSKD